MRRVRNYRMAPANTFYAMPAPVESAESAEARKRYNTVAWKIEQVPTDGSPAKVISFNDFYSVFCYYIRGFAQGVRPDQISFYLIGNSSEWAASALLADLLWTSAEVHTCKAAYRLIREEKANAEKTAKIVELKTAVAAIDKDKDARREKLARQAVPFVRRNGECFVVPMPWAGRGPSGYGQTACAVWRDREDGNRVKCNCPGFVANPSVRCEHILAVKYHLEEQAKCNWCGVSGSTCKQHSRRVAA